MFLHRYTVSWSLLSILNIPLDGNQASIATLSLQVILHRHTLSTEEEEKREKEKKRG